MEVNKILIVFVLLFYNITTNAQFKEIAAKDWHHAIYDAARLSDSTLFCVGENNEAFVIDINSGDKEYFTPTITTIAWLHILQINNDSAFVIGDHESIGWFYFKDFKNKIIVKESNKAYYAGVSLNNKLITAGGKTNVANGVKALPNGFVSQIVNGNSQKIKRPFRFFFHTYTFNNKVYTVGYNAFNSKTFEVKNSRLKAVKKYPYLIHRIVIDGTNQISCGTTTFKRKHALIIENDQVYKFENKDVVWDVKRVGNCLIGGGSNGLIYKKQDGVNSFTIMQTSYSGHYYRIVPINNTLFAAVGQYGRVVLASLAL